MDELSKVQVAVRLRPMNKRELDLCTKCVVDMQNDQTILYHPDVPFGVAPKSGSHVKRQPKTFAFDNCFWSMDDRNTSKFQGQDVVFDNVGRGLLNNAFCGYNACIFAYGQTGSGKSYTMMGTHEQKGIIPQLCDALFERITSESNSDEQSHKVEVSYMEIYNEKVHDLLDPGSKGNLKVREHKILGPYVDGLSLLAVNCYEDIENLMVEGNKSRTVAATNMNSESSRSHAVFTIKLTHTLFDRASGVSGERVSKMSLVDLAGSERVTKTGAIGERLKEGSNINKSLTTLGLVIKALAESSAASSKSKKGHFVPYRDSVLTWLLKDNLGGNSKTIMIATVSPSADNYEETLSTLRYADSAKRIVNRAVVNEDPNARIIRELRSEVETLRIQLVQAESMKAPDLKEKLQESEKLMEQLSKTWEEKLQETERIHKERHLALESMGVSVETSGIKVESDKCYLVNLNADPSLNELLVYYLKDVTKVGSGNNSTTQDIQLKGLGILPDHCTIEIENNKDVYISPVEGARTWINGSPIVSKTRAKHGDRILWGNNHFFRLNIPRRDMMSSSSELAEELYVDYDFAQQEIMQQAHDPIQESIEAIERQYEDDKQAALEAQKQMYEEQMMMLRNKISTTGVAGSPVPWNHYLAGSQTSSNVNDRLQRRIQQMAQERNSKFKQGLSRLKEDLVKVNIYAREANELAHELHTDARYSVTLQIPSSNLSPNRRRGALMSEPEPAILASNSENKTQVFTMEEFESRLVAMRELYQEHKDKGPLLPEMDVADNPFLVTAESHDLIGVANVFLDALFYDVKLDYNVAIINQQGEVAGRLRVELSKLEGSLNESYVDDVSSIGSDEEETSAGNSREITLKVCIKEAKGLPPLLSKFVFCQYTFWGQEMVVVAPKVDENMLEEPTEGTASYKFDDEREFTVVINEEFTEHLYDGALSIEVYGHSSEETGGPFVIGRSLADRWSEVTRKLEMSVEIQELNDQGVYEPVEVQVKPDVYCGGVFQLRQGYSRRMIVRTKPVATTGSLPLTVDSITVISIGGLCIRSLTHKGLDSYQEDGLSLLRSRWNEALEKRKDYLHEKMQVLAAKQDKSQADIERENNLMTQWLSLAEERNDVLVPQSGSGVPGAPATGEPEFGVEHHSPVIYLDLNIEDMAPRNHSEDDDVPVAELAFLDKEMGTTFLPLPAVTTDNNVSSIVTSWDSSIHDSIHLNRITPHNERIYMIVKAYVRLSHPAPIDITLRKRICLNIYKNQSLTMKLRKKISKTANTMGAKQNAVGRLLHVQDNLTAVGVLYDIVSNIPKASEELEDRETMAKLAASGYETQDSSGDGESYIEKYIKSVAAVESIITLDRLGQEVAIKDSLLASGRSPIRTFSSPNISAVLDIMYGSLRTGVDTIMKNSTSTPSFTEKMRSPLMKFSESIQDISRYVMKSSASANNPLTQTAMTASTTSSGSEDTNGAAAHHKKGGLKLSGSGPGADGNPASADEGYGSTPRRFSAATAGQSIELSGRGDEQQLDSKPGEDGRKALNFDNAPASEESTELIDAYLPEKEDNSKLYKSLQETESKAAVINNAFQNNVKIASSPRNYVLSDSSNETTQFSLSDDQLEVEPLQLSQSDNDTTNLNQSDDSNQVESNENKDTDQSDMDATPTKQLINLPSGHKQLGSPEAPLASVDSDCGTAENTPQHRPTLPIHSKADDNELLIVEDAGVPTSNYKAAADPLPVNSRSAISQHTTEDEEEEDDLDSYSEGGARGPNGDKKSRADLLSDFYSMNALDDLEAALGDSMESLNSCCSSELEIVPVVRVSHEVKVDELKVSTPYNAKVTPSPTAAPLLIDDDDEDGDSHSDLDEENDSLYSFGSTADLSGYTNTPLPPWIEVGVSVIVLSTKGDSPEKGYIRYVGETEFAVGSWVGVQLDSMKGKNNGSVQGFSYFDCKPNHGVFVRHDRLVIDRKRPNQTFPVSHKVVVDKISRPSPTAASTPSYLRATHSSKSRKS